MIRGQAFYIAHPPGEMSNHVLPTFLSLHTYVLYLALIITVVP